MTSINTCGVGSDTLEFRNSASLLGSGWLDSKPTPLLATEEMENPRKFQRMMTRAGYNRNKAWCTWMRMTTWQSVKRREVCFVMNLQWFRQRGLIFLKSFVQKQKFLELAFTR